MEQVVLTRIRELLVYRHWSRLHPNLLTGHSGQQIRREYTVELRALVKLAREARRAERTAPDPLSQYKSYADWTQGELVAGWGK